MVSVISELGSPFWSGVATTLAFISAIAAIYNFLSARARRIFYEVIDSTIVANPSIQGVSVSVECNETVGSALHKRTVFIINKTKGALDDSEFVGPPFSCRKSEGKIYKVGKVNLPSSGQFEPFTETDSVGFANLQCPINSCLVLEILHDGCISGELVSHSKGAGSARKYKISEWKFYRNVGPFFVLVPFVSFLAFILGTAVKGDANQEFSVEPAQMLLAAGLMMVVLVLSSRWFSPIGERLFIRSDAEREFRAYVGSER